MKIAIILVTLSLLAACGGLKVDDVQTWSQQLWKDIDKNTGGGE